MDTLSFDRDSKIVHLTLSEYASIIASENENMTIPPQFGGGYFEGCQPSARIFRNNFSHVFLGLVSSILKTPVFADFSTFLSRVRPAPHFFQFSYFTSKISIFVLRFSSCIEHSSRRYACPKTLVLPRFQRIAIF